MPINLVYTYTNAEIHGTGNTQGFLDGDMLAAIPESSFSLRLGLNTASGWDHYGVVKYIDETCVNVGCNRSDSIYAKNEDLLVIDYVSHFPISDKLAIYLKVENLLDEDSIISRQPDGARPNKKRTASIGIELNF
jgi:Fe(3+) dicitrate transport protein